MTSTNESQPLYAAREPVFPKRVKGRFRTIKWWIMGIALAVYYITPWIRWDRGPKLPDQAVLVDLAHRRFYFFFIEIWPHEFYFIAGLLIMAGLGLFLFTSAAGRVWCGYGCPQTIWTDLFIQIERWVEGDRNARIRLRNAPWNARKIRLRLTKWFLWTLVAVSTGGAWVFYFADAPTLFHELITFQAPMIAYTTMALLTATTLLMGGIAREQVCIYMCPWPRIQAAMMDEDTLVIAYRSWRGEPRGKHRKAEGADKLGDCIDCRACVNVCPMGIDIRDGQQLECITCGLCIDACDEMMDKVGKPRGLIGYMALTDEALERAGKPPKPIWKHILRPRTLLYTALWSSIGIAMLVALLLRPSIDMSVAPVRNPLYVVLSDGSVRDTYDVRLRNKNGEDHEIRMAVDPADPFRLELEGEEGTMVLVPANQTLIQRVYVIAPRGSGPDREDRVNITLIADDQTNGEKVSVGTVFHGKSR